MRFEGVDAVGEDFQAFAEEIRKQVAQYSYADRGVILIGWQAMTTAEDYMDKDTGSLVLEPLGDGTCGHVKLVVPGFEFGTARSSEMGYSFGPGADAIAVEATRVVTRLVADCRRLVPSGYPYDVALSFASEQREYVDLVARSLRDFGLSVFYDEFEQASLWGKDGIETFTELYAGQAFRVVLFISEAYVRKAWPTIERKATLSRLLTSAEDNHILPVRFDDTPVPGLPPQILFQRAADYTPITLADLIVENLDQAGHASAATFGGFSEAKQRAGLVQFRSLVHPEGDGCHRISYRIHNGSGSAIGTVVMAVVDPSRPEADPDAQVDCALELVMGPVGAGETVEGDCDMLQLLETPAFEALGSLATLLWTDRDDNHWATSGADLRRRLYPARSC